MISRPMITPDSTLLVTGGAKGITADCIIQLAKKCSCNFILVGRSRLEPFLPDWFEEISDEADIKRRIMSDLQARGEKASPRLIQKIFQNYQSHREINRTLTALQDAGCAAEYVSADVSDFDELQGVLQDPINRYGGVNGIVHGAGSLADKLMEKKTLEDFETVFRPKIDGLKNLLKLVPPDNLDVLALFSSVVGFYGNAGQADYAIANEILNKTAYQLKVNHPDLQVVSFNWGPWEAGMVTPELKRAFSERGITLLSREDGTKVFVETLMGNSLPANQLVVGEFPSSSRSIRPASVTSYQIRRQLSRAANPFLEDHLIGGNPVLPATCGAAWMVNTCEELYPGYSFHRLEGFKVLKGIVFDKTIPTEYTVTIHQQPAEKEGEISLSAEVSSQNLRGGKLYHYRQKVVMVEKLPDPPIHTYEKNMDTRIPGSTLYEDKTLFHGPAFQGVDELLSLDQSGLQMKIFHPQVEENVQGQFPVRNANPFINDAVVQCLLIWTQKMLQAPCLPSSAEALELFQPLNFDEPYFVDLKIRSQSQTAVLGDITVSDGNNRVCLRILGLEGTISRQLGRFIGAQSTNDTRSGE